MQSEDGDRYEMITSGVIYLEFVCFQERTEVKTQTDRGDSRLGEGTGDGPGSEA